MVKREIITMKTYFRIARNVLICIILIFVSYPGSSVADEKENPGYCPIYDITRQCLLGAWTRDGWLDYDSAATFINGGEQYTFYSLYKSMGTATGSPAEYSDNEPCTYLIDINFSKTIKSQEHIIAVSAPWNALPRIPKKIKTGSAVRSILTDYLKANGISKPKLNIKQAFIVDLDGSGNMDTVIAATYYKGEFWDTPKVGFYSVVLIRRSVGGKSVTIPVMADVYSKNTKDCSLMYEYSLLGFFDLNNDGRLEILISGEYYEGSTAALMQLIDNNYIVVIACGCNV